MLLSAGIILGSCNKEAKQNGELVGTWVERNFEHDTLVVYQSNGKSFLLDNSELYRSSRGIFPGNEYFTWEYRLKKESIGLRSVIQVLIIFTILSIG